jgi:hypothetical protein
MKVELAKSVRQKQKLERLVHLEPTLQPVLKEVNERLSRMGHVPPRAEEKQLQTLEPSPLRVRPSRSPRERQPHPVPSRIAFASPETLLSRLPVAKFPTSSDIPRLASPSRPDLARPTLPTSPTPPLAAALSRRAAPIDSSGDREIPVPDLDPDGRVVSSHPLGRDEWDRLSDSSGEGDGVFQRLKTGGPKPYVDVHAFLQSVYVREQTRALGADSEAEEDIDDDQSASSVY